MEKKLNLANAFTMLRVVLVPVFAFLILGNPPRTTLAAIVFAVAAATDGLDGWVARKLNQVTGFGQFLDPLADKLLVGVALAALCMDGRVPWWVAGIIWTREIAISVYRVVLARRGQSLPASSLGKLKTLVQIVTVVVVTATAKHTVLANATIAVAVVLSVVSGLAYALDARRRVVTWT